MIDLVTEYLHKLKMYKGYTPTVSIKDKAICLTFKYGSVGKTVEVCGAEVLVNKEDINKLLCEVIVRSNADKIKNVLGDNKPKKACLYLARDSNDITKAKLVIHIDESTSYEFKISGYLALTSYVKTVKDNIVYL